MKKIKRFIALAICIMICFSTAMGDTMLVRGEDTIQESGSLIKIPETEEETTSSETPETEQQTPEEGTEESGIGESEGQEATNTGVTEDGSQEGQPEAEKNADADGESIAPETEGEDTPTAKEAEKEKKENSIFSEEKAAGITISTDRATGIGQIQTLIPDPVFAAAVYDAFVAAGYMGDGTKTLEQLLADFTGEIDANGFVKKVEYKVTANKVVLSPYSEEPISQIFDTQEKAQEFYDGLVNDMVNGILYTAKKLEGPIITQTTDKKPDNELVKSIEGILYLRKATYINLEGNEIKDLTPLDINKAIALDSDGTSENGQKWFENSSVTTLNLQSNPINKIPLQLAGRIKFDPGPAESEWSFGVLPTIYIKGEIWNPISKEIDIPPVQVNNNNVTFNRINIYQKDKEPPRNTIPGLGNDTLTVNHNKAVLGNILGSGEVEFVVSAQNLDDMFHWYSGTSGGGISPESSSVNIVGIQKIRIYYETKPETSKTDVNLDFVKYISGTEEGYIVEGARYNLYKAEKQPDGSYLSVGDPISASPYETDANGKIILNEMMDKGSYCFVEESAPEGFKVDTTPIGFDIGGGTIKITGGDTPITTDDGQTHNGIYIDRYSADISFTITPDAGTALKKVNVTYLDWNDVEVTEEFDTAIAAQNWINANKGTETERGKINGTVKIQPIFEQIISTKATNEYKTKDFEFEKVDADTGKKLAGVEFRLSCLHEHDDKCGGKDAPSKCSHPHVVLSKGGASDEKGCTWTTTVTSETDKNVSFAGLVTGKYRLEEIKTADDSYLLPKGDWFVEVDTESDTIKITPSNDKVPEIDPVDGEIYYRLRNQKTVPFSFTKVDAENTEEALQGAEFELYRLTCTNTDPDHTHDDTCWTDKLSVISGADGRVDFGRLATGKYKLLETKAPDGFVVPSGYWILTVNPYEEKPLDIEGVGQKKPPAVKTEAALWKIPNLRVQTLPVSGGMGTFLFTVGGLLLIGGAVLILFIGIRKKKGSDIGGGAD